MKLNMIVLLFMAGLFLTVHAAQVSAQEVAAAPLPMMTQNAPLPMGVQSYDAQAWGRFYHYPYVYYPKNFNTSESYRSANSLYNRYPRSMQVPMYNPYWQNYYPVPRRFHEGKHFVLDVF